VYQSLQCRVLSLRLSSCHLVIVDIIFRKIQTTKTISGYAIKKYNEKCYYLTLVNIARPFCMTYFDNYMHQFCFNLFKKYIQSSSNSKVIGTDGSEQIAVLAGRMERVFGVEVRDGAPVKLLSILYV
jgi:hypothetical protein